MINRDIAKIAVEAAKIRKDYPELDHRQAIERAKEVLGYEKMEKVAEVN